jgi:hypothetical protein
MRKKEYIQQQSTNLEILRTISVRAMAGLLVCILFSHQAAAQAIRVNLSIKDKIVLTEQEPFTLKPSVDFTTNAKIMEGSCVLNLSGADNLWVKAAMPAFIILRNEQGDRILCTTHLSYRNDGQNTYNGIDSGNITTFPLSDTGQLAIKGREPAQLFKAYLFVFIRTRLVNTASDSYSGDVNLSIEYN